MKTLAALLLGALLGGAVVAQMLRPRAPVADAQRATVVLSHDQRASTGVVVDRDRGWILTNAHVVRAGIRQIEGLTTAGPVALEHLDTPCVDAKRDLAVVAVRAPLRTGEAKLGAVPRVMGEIFTVGHPTVWSTLDGTVRYVAHRGHVSQTIARMPGWDVDMFLVNLAAGPGFSGAGVFTMNGRLVGLVTTGGVASSKPVGTYHPAGLTFAVRPEAIRDFITGCQRNAGDVTQIRR